MSVSAFQLWWWQSTMSQLSCKSFKGLFEIPQKNPKVPETSIGTVTHCESGFFTRAIVVHNEYRFSFFDQLFQVQTQSSSQPSNKSYQDLPGASACNLNCPPLRGKEVKKTPSILANYQKLSSMSIFKIVTCKISQYMNYKLNRKQAPIYKSAKDVMNG